MPVASSTASNRAKARTALPEPGVVTAIDLEEHPLARHALAPGAVQRWAAAARARDARPGQDAPHRGAAEGDAFTLVEELGEVAVVGPVVARGGEAGHLGRQVFGDGVVGTAAAVAVGERPRAAFPVGGEQPPRVACTEAHQRRRFSDLDLPGDDAVEDVEPCLFVLVQCHFLHGRTDSLTS